MGRRIRPNCPLDCGDYDRKLVVSYEYGVQSPTSRKNFNRDLFRCFKANCQKEEAKVPPLRTSGSTATTFSILSNLADGTTEM